MVEHKTDVVKAEENDLMVQGICTCGWFGDAFFNRENAERSVKDHLDRPRDAEAVT